jgi:hypothetical protein
MKNIEHKKTDTVRPQHPSNRQGKTQTVVPIEPAAEPWDSDDAPWAPVNEPGTEAGETEVRCRAFDMALGINQDLGKLIHVVQAVSRQLEPVLGALRDGKAIDWGCLDTLASCRQMLTQVRLGAHDGNLLTRL